MFAVPDSLSPFIRFSYPIIHSTVGDDKITRKILTYPKKFIRTLEILLDFPFYYVSIKYLSAIHKLFTINSLELKAILFIIKINKISRCAYTFKRFSFCFPTRIVFVFVVFRSQMWDIKIKITIVLFSTHAIVPQGFFPPLTHEHVREGRH
jgi:hypothetical protein